MNRTIVRTSDYGPVSTAAPQPACVGFDPELFFPHALATDQIEEAKAVCRSCPLMEPCGAGALSTSDLAGVWGGMSEDDRRKIKRRAGRQRAGKTASA
ncbi:WhiB family transcriptional regulator [Streptomyces sp. NPDC058595]|uniref:WhiB family transcriptional regulator n=1 Tax=Streptomyces sp. NPDC058595 TaxID=3346550 RepID=UPI00365A1403